MIVTIGKSMFGRSSCFRLPQLATPPPKTASAMRMVTLRRATASLVRKNMEPPLFTDWSGQQCPTGVVSRNPADDAAGLLKH